MLKRFLRRTGLVGVVIGSACSIAGCGATCNSACQAAIRDAAIGVGVLGGTALTYCEANPSKYQCSAALGKQ